MTDPGKMEFRRMLVSLSKLLKEDEIKTMKFLCGEFIKKREMEAIESVTDLWENLETKEKIGPNNLDFLKNLITNSCNGRMDVERIIQDYENNARNPAIQQSRGYQQQIHHPQMPVYQQTYVRNAAPVADFRDMKREVDIITKNLGREWRFFMRALGLTDADMLDVESDCPRNMREQIYRCLSLWASNPSHNPTKEKLIEALRDQSVERNDLICMIQNQ